MSRACTNSSPIPLAVKIPKMEESLKKLRKFLKEKGDMPVRFNLDEVGLELFSDRERTVAPIGTRRIQLHVGGQGKARRFCTIIININSHGGGSCGLIFKAATGERIMAQESDEYHKRIYVRFQANAWADSKTLLSSIRDLALPAGSLLFMDSLRSHRGTHSLLTFR